MSDFVHLHVHTEASLLDGLARIQETFDVTAANGQGAVAITDHGTRGGLWKAKAAAAKTGVKLIPGEEVYVALNPDGTFGDRFRPGVMETTDLGDDSDDDEGVKKKRYYHLTVLAASRTGWDNLVRLGNASEHSKFGKYPLVDIDLLREHREGLIILTGCLGGPVLGPVAAGDMDLARGNLAALVDAFGPENLYVEVMEHGIRPETRALPAMKRLADEAGLTVVATNDAHYARPEQRDTHDAWLALRTKATLDDPKRYRFTGHGYHLRTADEMLALFDPASPGDPDSLLDESVLASALTALESPLLKAMLSPAAWDDDVWAEVQSLRTAHHPLGALGSLSVRAREFLARAAREQSRLDDLGRPSEVKEHPRHWWSEAVSASARVADRVSQNVVPDGNPHLPAFPTPEGYATNVAYMGALVNAGADRLYGTPRPQAVSDRLNEEWSVIKGMGFIDYFLIDHDFVSWARSEHCVHSPVGPEEALTGTPAPAACDVEGCEGHKVPILVGPGRGSAAGSLIAYCLGITGVDPLENDLLFERFLEPGRADFPDIDIDFEKSRREDVLDYLTSRWGEGHVALIGAYGVSKTRRSIRDAARLLDQSSVGNALAKVIPVNEGQPMSFEELLDESVQQSAEFRRELEKAGERGREVLDLAMGFSDTINGATIHACGVVISDLYLPDLIPLRVHKNGRYVTEWDSKDIESFGLIKFDVLALRNLDIAHTAMRYIEEVTGEQLSIADIPHPDVQGDPRVERTWALLRDGRTAGIFQMEGAAMTALAQDVQPSGIDDLSAILALFRPGPISAGMPEHYGLRKNGKEPVEYSMYTSRVQEQEAIATRLGDTYALIVYQEQLMLLGTTIAGFDASMRSTLRKAIGKKNKELMAQVKDEFLSGAEREVRDAHGNIVSAPFQRETAERVWSMFEGAASYAFNKSHSLAYAYLAYWTAFLKANWPGAYGAAILANTGDMGRRVEALRALNEEGITVLAPDVNKSGAQSRPEGQDRVRLGIGEISGVKSAGEKVVEERKNGPFRDLADLVHRVRVDEMGNKHLPSNELTGLIEAGALDDFGPRLGQVMVLHQAPSGLPAGVPPMEWGVIERTARQRQRLGISIGTHPLVTFQNEVRSWRKQTDDYGAGRFVQRAIPIGAIPTEPGKEDVLVIGVLSKWKEDSYRGGRKAAIGLEGSTESIECVMWDRDLAEQKLIGIPNIGWPVAVTGRVNIREFEQEDDEGNIVLRSVKQLTVRRVDAVDIDDPVQGALDSDVDVPDFTSVIEDESASATPEQASSRKPDGSPARSGREVQEVFVHKAAFRRLLVAQLEGQGIDADGLDWSPRFSSRCSRYELSRSGDIEIIVHVVEPRTHTGP